MNPTDFTIGRIKGFECLNEAWAAIKPNYWLLFAIMFVGFIIGGATLYILLGAMICGIYLAMIKQIDGETATFDDLFAGMKFIGKSLVVTLFFIAPVILLYAAIYIPWLFIVFSGGRMDEGTVMVVFGALLVFELIFAVIMVCFHTLLMFSYQLIIDRGLSAMDAIKVSARAVMKNLGGVCGVIGVNMLLILAGYLALCFGVYFTLPVILAVNCVAYRKAFPAMTPINDAPPPPNAYQGI